MRVRLVAALPALVVLSSAAGAFARPATDGPAQALSSDDVGQRLAAEQALAGRESDTRQALPFLRRALAKNLEQSKGLREDPAGRARGARLVDERNTLIRIVRGLGRDAAPLLPELIALWTSDVDQDSPFHAGEAIRVIGRAAIRDLLVLVDDDEHVVGAARMLATIAGDLQGDGNVGAIADLEAVRDALNHRRELEQASSGKSHTSSLWSYENAMGGEHLDPLIARALEALKDRRARLAVRSARDPLDSPLAPLVVMIEATLPDGAKSVGAAIIFGRSASRVYLVTADHVVRSTPADGSPGDSAVIGRVRALPGERIQLRLLADHDPQADLAVLAVDRVQDVKALLDARLRLDVLGSGPTPGTPLSLIGYCDGKPWFVPLPGVFKAEVDRILRIPGLPAPGGCSGGAVFDSDRLELVGIVRSEDPLEAQAVPIAVALGWLRQRGYPIDLIPAVRAEELSVALGSGRAQTGANHDIQVGRIGTGDQRTMTLRVQNLHGAPLSLALRTEGPLQAAWADESKETTLDPAKTAEVVLRLQPPPGTTEAKIVLDNYGAPLVTVHLDFTVASHGQAVSRDLGPVDSGRGADFSPPYNLCLGPAPDGYTLKPETVQASLTGDRSCGAWSTCQVVRRDDTDVCMVFTLQGHNEGGDPVRKSTGHLRAEYQLRQDEPRLAQATTH